MSEMAKKGWSDPECRSKRTRALSELYRNIVAEDPEKFSSLMSERAKKGWNNAEYRNKRAANIQARRHGLMPDYEAKILDFIKDRKKPWKALECQLGISYSTLRVIRQEMGLPMNIRDKKYG